MSNTFKFVGQIKKLNDDKNGKKPYETAYLKSGWMIDKVKFRMACGDTSEFVDMSGGKYQDDSKNIVYTSFVKEESPGKKTTEQAQVAWKDRFNPDIVAKVPSYKKYTIDLLSEKIRSKMNEAGEAIPGDKEHKEVFISQYDFAVRFRDLLLKGAFGEDNYVVNGTVDYTYAFDKEGVGRYYRNFTPTNIYKASEDDVVGAFGKVDFYFATADSDGIGSENGDTFYPGYLQFYERTTKKNFYAPVSVTIQSGYEKEEGLKKVFAYASNVEDEVSSVSLSVKFFDGTPLKKVTEEDLSDDQKWLISIGVKTLEEAINELERKDIAEDSRVSYIYVLGLPRNGGVPVGVEELTADMLAATPDLSETATKKKTAVSEAVKKVTNDIFDEEDL